MKAAMIIFLSIIAPVWGHWVLNSPTAMGFDDETESKAPCGGFDIANRTTVTEWPVAGQPVSLLSAHTSSIFEFRAALVSDPKNWITMQPNVSQKGAGHVCFSQVPGVESLAGQDAVVQMIANGADGPLYQVSNFHGAPF